MYKIKVSSAFSAAHFLRGYKGKCEALHGHNWKVEAVISSDKLDSLGLVMDFGEAKEKLDRILEELDHGLLNEREYFKKHNPTSEIIASYIFNQLKPEISSLLTLEEVRVWEKETSCAVYQE